MKQNLHDATSLAMAEVIAANLPQHPEWLDVARRNLDNWTRQNSDAPALIQCYQEWREVLDRPIREICMLLTEQSSNGQRLRRNSPFAGVLDPETVLTIKRRMRHEATAA